MTVSRAEATAEEATAPKAIGRKRAGRKGGRTGRGRFRGHYSAESQPRAWLFLLPALVFIGAFNILPLIRIFVMAFQGGSLLHPKFYAFRNFAFVLRDPEFHTAIINTALYAFVVVPVGLILSMLIAIMIHSRMKAKGFFEALFFVPYLTSVIAIGIVFRYLFNGDYGLINYLLGLVHLGPFNFLNNPSLNMPTLIIFGIWSSLAFNIIIMLSGLRGINPDYYKVADMFGASAWEQFRRITMPQMIPILTFLSIVDFISSFKVYTEVYALFNGQAGIAGAASTAVFYIYNKFYVDNKYGQGMAGAVLLFLLILVFTLLQNLALRKLSK
ncbi:carbohydrate ABC transporter permease [Bifidobacterium sp.]|jgi:multiple sugar transport system permease protein|uniref:carbohydrate ABC transporter permease n=1 Tax=Bifidobacterium sp. TaxID=41200 RepID=UPI0025C05798|nr:sugar ABC transporter permease [Bifidobacterium sp.]MCH4208646.1 sugar ABC transporter permease [Bifidobacterium sp.]MCI1224382.1 sugar ABC transporter permease [Bifidobacterium sp.]